jgi:lysozyme family protein
MDAICDRRTWLLSASSSVVMLATAKSVRAQEIPSPTDILAFETAVRALELEANRMGLAAAMAPVRAGPPVRVTARNQYLQTMPRLVELLDRAEGTVALEERAGGYLSALHATQWEIPEIYLQGARPPRPSFTRLQSEYRRKFDALRLRPQFASNAAWHVQTLLKGRTRYEAIESKLGIPWYFVGCVHALESSFNFRGHLHNGDPLRLRTTHVPRNRPTNWLPPDDWVSSAEDALTLMRLAHASDWTLERMLYRFEQYNGFGYRRHGVPSPYLWSFSDQYERGKYRSDGVFDRTLRSQQCGVGVMIKMLVQGRHIPMPPRAVSTGGPAR